MQKYRDRGIPGQYVNLVVRNTPKWFRVPLVVQNTPIIDINIIIIISSSSIIKAAAKKRESWLEEQMATV